MALGFDFPKPGRVFEERLDIVIRLWASEALYYAGQLHKLEGIEVMPPTPRGRIPLYIGGYPEKAIDRVLTYGDGYGGIPRDLYVQKPREQVNDISEDKVCISRFFTVVPRDRCGSLSARSYNLGCR